MDPARATLGNPSISVGDEQRNQNNIRTHKTEQYCTPRRTPCFLGDIIRNTNIDADELTLTTTNSKLTLTFRIRKNEWQICLLVEDTSKLIMQMFYNRNNVPSSKLFQVNNVNKKTDIPCNSSRVLWDDSSIIHSLVRICCLSFFHWYHQGTENYNLWASCIFLSDFEIQDHRLWILIAYSLHKKKTSYTYIKFK